jgi:hypothetical protein
MKKKIIPVIIVFVAVVFISGYIYRCYHPDITIGIGGGHGLEIISVVTTGPIADVKEEQLKEIADWNNEVTYVLFNETMEPRNIKVSGEVEDGKTTLRYEGNYTSKDGETLQFFEEMTFNFVLVPNDELLK